MDNFPGFVFTSNGSSESQKAERALRDAVICIVTEVNRSVPQPILRWGSYQYTGLKEIKEFAEIFFTRVTSGEV